MAEGFQAISPLKKLNKALEHLFSMGIEINLWKSQNLYFSMLKTYKKLPKDLRNAKWEKHFFKLGDHLGVKTWS
ncbi:MAG: hypothetical protein AAF242_06030 [Bacteroidota bacterium]